MVHGLFEAAEDQRPLHVGETDALAFACREILDSLVAIARHNHELSDELATCKARMLYVVAEMQRGRPLREFAKIRFRWIGRLLWAVHASPTVDHEEGVVVPTKGAFRPRQSA